MHKKVFLYTCVIFLFFIPFFWTKPGELNIGGDLGGTYFYDPVNFIKHYVLYGQTPFGTGILDPNYYFLPFVLLVALLKLFLSSSVINTLHTSLILVLGFLSTYGIIKELIPSKMNKINPQMMEIISVLTGIFYILSPLFTIYNRYVHPISTLDQIFLNPLIFYLLLKYILTKSYRYVWILLVTTLLFSHNFSYTAAPPIFSFYPLAFTFLALYLVVIRKKNVPVKGLIILTLFFIGLHLFHTVPEVTNLFDSGSTINVRVFSNKERNEATLTYFQSVIGYTSLAKNILLPSPDNPRWLIFSFISSLIILLGFLKNRFKSRLFLLTGLFFLITLFLISAKVGYLGIKFYELFFLYVPGSAMFRNFYIQWLYVFSFFYTLLFGQALFLIFTKLTLSKQKLVALLLLINFIGNAWVFIKGESFNPIHAQSANVGEHVIMDPQYEKTLSFIRTLPDDGKILQFPFSDYDYQVVHGINNSAYDGTSTIGQFTGVKDFVGYWHTVPYSKAFLESSKKKDYETLMKILGFLNIRYIFYNSDPNIYDTTFAGRPFDYVRQYLPKSQKEYKEFIKPLISEKIFEAGHYKIYSTVEESYLPHMYIPIETVKYDYDSQYDKYYDAASSFATSSAIMKNFKNEERIVYVEKDECINKPLLRSFCGKDTVREKAVPQLYFQKINPLKYIVKITNIEDSFFLVFSDAFHRKWKLFLRQGNVVEQHDLKKYFDGDIKEGKSLNIFLNRQTFETLGLPSIPETQHLKVNAFANAWYITPKNIGMNHEAIFILEMTGQRVFYITLMLSLIVFSGFFVWGIVLLLKTFVSFFISFYKITRS
ncbi:MAG: hypothetical protein A3H79_01115 [Candidatus Levybacteria bacterium RIFCSPLOWO2_02_FULL_36_8b]|nr:MAG: hypothetical protein A3H79_01115 [Candidatus Levybacteria bacterium RIFCSPLOWO2_02_FULL_36_8b]